MFIPEEENKLITMSSDLSLKLCDLEQVETPISLSKIDPFQSNFPSPPTVSTFINNNPTIFATGDDEGGVKLWDLRTKDIVAKSSSLSKHDDFVSCLSSFKSHSLLSLSSDTTLHLHDLRKMKTLVESEAQEDELTGFDIPFACHLSLW